MDNGVPPSMGGPGYRGGAGNEPGGRRPRRHREIREEILSVARAIIMEHGADGLTLREIAKRTDFTPSALYRYFPRGRSEILLAVARDSLAVLEEQMAHVSASLGPADRIVAMGREYLRFAAEHPAEVLLLFDSITATDELDLARPDEAFLAPTSVYRLLEAAFREGMADGTFSVRDEDLMMVMHATWALVHGLTVVELLHERHGGVFGDRGQEVLRALLNGFGTAWAAPAAASGE